MSPVSTVVWLVLGLALIGAELLTLDFILVMLGVAALVAGLAALLSAPFWLTALVFAGVSVLLLLLVRPVAKRHFEVKERLQGADLLPGRKAVVVNAVHAQGGQVRMDGELWAARPHVREHHLIAGTPVVVAYVEGVTLHVYPEETS